MLESGMCRSSDIISALVARLGFAFISRAALYDAVADGNAGVRKVLEILRDEVDRLMVLLNSITETSFEVFANCAYSLSGDGAGHQ